MTLSSISPDLSKHSRFLAFWLSLCYGSFLLCLVVFFIVSCALYCVQSVMIHYYSGERGSSRRRDLVTFLDFFAKTQGARELIKTRELYLYADISRDRLSHRTKNYHISVSIRKSAKRGHCMCAEQECCIMTD